jgi:hypothetical protein
MIQFNGVSPFASDKVSDASIATRTDQAISDSFQSQLSAALTATLQKFGIDPSKVALSIAPIRSDAGSQPTPAAASQSSVTPPPPAGAPADGSLASHDPILTFDDAYWAKQPQAVQALRNMDDSGQRSVLAAQLGAAGYKIDVPIMVWGWDPAKVSTLRQGLGYSWVPSAFQNPVAAAPGINDLATPYDPSNPPSGSIAV